MSTFAGLDFNAFNLAEEHLHKALGIVEVVSDAICADLGGNGSERYCAALWSASTNLRELSDVLNAGRVQAKPDAEAKP